jgi:hypothetical protein
MPPSLNSVRDTPCVKSGPLSLFSSAISLISFEQQGLRGSRLDDYHAYRRKFSPSVPDWLDACIRVEVTELPRPRRAVSWTIAPGKPCSISTEAVRSAQPLFCFRSPKSDLTWPSAKRFNRGVSGRIDAAATWRRIPRLNKPTLKGTSQCRCRPAKSAVVEILSLSVECGFI